MKKLLIALLIIILPSVIAVFLILYLFPTESKTSFATFKKEILSRIPIPLAKYFKEEQPPLTLPKKESPEPLIQQPPPKPIGFTNNDIYEAICAEKPFKNINEKFVGCNFCPKYLNFVENKNNFNYRFDSVGPISKLGSEEAIVFMEGCDAKNQIGTAILIRKGFAGWNRDFVFTDVFFESMPLLFQDQQGILFFIGTYKQQYLTNMQNNLVFISFKEKNLNKKYLVKSYANVGSNCDRNMQSFLDSPFKEGENKLIAPIEIVACKKNIPISGKHKIIFTIKNGELKPDINSSSLITKIEKSAE